MSTPAWTVTRTKRKAKSLTPAPRKRPRVNDIKGESNRSRRASDSQRTLTQAQWLTPPTSFEEEDKQPEREHAAERRRTPATKTRRAPLKRNTTLTQMDFLSFPPPDDADFDDSMLGPVGQGATLPPQLDGTYDSPRKPRNRKGTGTPSAAKPSSKRRKAPLHNESQDYNPSTRKRKSEVSNDVPSSPPRRSSKRLATKNEVFSDPVQNLAYFAEALGVTTPKKPEKETGNKLPIPLEIKDSVDDDVIDLESASPLKYGQTLLPQTPKRNRAIILSSQSPESLPPSTRRTQKRSTELPALSQRTPLAERSVNIPIAPVLKRSPYKAGRAPKRLKTRIVTLKLPKRGQSRVADSQANLWSIPSSSSPHQASKQSKKTMAQTHEKEQVAASFGEAEIPATSQVQTVKSSPPDIESEDSLPELSDLVGAKLPTERQGCENGPEHQAPSEDKTASDPIVRDFAVAPRPAKSQIGWDLGSTSRLPGEPSQLLGDQTGHPDRDEDMNLKGDDDDLGSPIANDTQFNVDVVHRISSPPLLPSHVEDSAEDPHNNAPPPSSGIPLTTLHSNAPPVSSQADVPNPPQTPMPLPRLVGSSTTRSPAKVVLDSEDEADEVAFPRPALLHRSSTHISTTRVPLNDIVPPRPSSPTLPSSSKTATPKSVFPASLPHPSQMSTQEATQGYLNMSSYPPQQAGELGSSSEDDKAEKITIKDSSSCQVSMSQLPQYTGGESQSQVKIELDLDEAFNNEVVDHEDEDEEGDLDLDPPSTLPSRSGRVGLGDYREIEIEDEDTTANAAAAAAAATPVQRRKTRTLGSSGGKTKAPEVEKIGGEVVGVEEARAAHASQKEDGHGRDDRDRGVHVNDDNDNDNETESPSVRPSQQSISLSISDIPSSPQPTPLQREYSPIPGFDNETQSNFTQNGHVTAYYIHRQHEKGILPEWFIPKPYQVPGYTRRK
ncbi:hypothetical protein ABEF95_004111 [Exophiala dermatitidis]